MLTATSYDDAVFETFLAHIWQNLVTEIGATPQDGIGEHPYRGHFFSFAVDKKERFAAFRWPLRAPNDDALLLGLGEAFCLPATLSAGRRGLRLGLQVHAPDGAAAATPPAFDLAGQLTERFNIAWSPPAKPLPAFLELAAILAARGNVAVSSHVHQQVIAELSSELAYFRTSCTERENEVRHLQQQLAAREEQLAALWSAPAAAPTLDEEQAEAARYPTSLDELPTWLQQFEGRLVVLPRALNGAKKSIYERPELIFAGLDFLAGPYCDARRGNLSAEGLEAALEATGLKIAGSVAPSIAGSQGDAYFVSWQGRRRFLELHLLRGGGRDERYCLRIYFFWDDETGQCVCGWLPSHLSNSLS